MTNYGSHQEQITDGLPQSLVDVASGGGALSGGGLLIPYTVAGGNALQISGPAGEIDLVADPDTGSATWELRADLTSMTQVRMFFRCASAGPSGALLKLKYSADDVTFSDIVSGGLTMALDATGWQDSDWQPVAAGAKAIVWLHLFGSGGDDFTTTANLKPFYLQFK